MTLAHNIEAFERMQSRLEAEHDGEWAIVHGGKLVGTYPSFESAGDIAQDLFAKGPCLIRQIGGPMYSVPAFTIGRGIPDGRAAV